MNLLEPVKLKVINQSINQFLFAQICNKMTEIVTVVKFRVNYGGGNGADCFEVKI